MKRRRPGESFTWRGPGPVRVLSGIDPQALHGPHEAAFVYEVADAAGVRVEAMRDAWPSKAPPNHQLVPHLTLLFLGICQGPLLGRLVHALDALAHHLVADVELGPVGEFVTPSGNRTLHLAAEPADLLRAQHQAAEAAAIGCGWRPVSRWSGAAFSPHVTIFDRAGAALVPEDLIPPLRIGPVRLTMPFVIGKPVSDLHAL